jgi:uncharacterized protein YkwD
MHRQRLAFLFLPLGVACTAPDPLSGYGGAYGQQQGTSADDGGTTTAQPVQQPGAAPSPLHHGDAGSWEGPDAQAPVAVEPPIAPGDDASPGAGPLGDDAGTGPDSSGEDAGSSNAALLSACVGGINSFRGQNGLPPYTVSTALETFAAQAAASDARSGQQDGYFNGNGGNNVSSAEDELVGAQVDPGATATQVLTQGLLDEEDGEIDGNGNLLSQQFSQVGCGVAQGSDGNYWIAIEYR